MAEIVNLSMFKNDGISYNNGDILQQALQGVIKDDHDNNDIEPQTIRLTQQQAAALGLSCQVDSSQGIINTIVQQNQKFLFNEMDNMTNGENLKQTTANINNFPLNNWMQNINELAEIQEATLSSQITPRIVDLETIDGAKDTRAYLFQNVKVHNTKTNTNVQQPQISCSVQKIPIILPQSQYITMTNPVKPLMKTNKTVRLITTSNQNSIATANVAQNSFLMNNIQKLNSTNGLIAQTSKNGVVTTQLTNEKLTSMQLNAYHHVNGANTPICVPVKSQIGKKANTQQVYVSRPTDIVKSFKIQIPNSRVVPACLIKPATAQIARPTAPNVVKSSVPGQTKPNSQVIVTSMLKNQDVNTMLPGNDTVHSHKQIVSLLKHQPKVGMVNDNIQYSIVQPTKIIKNKSNTHTVLINKKTIQNYVNSDELQSNLINCNVAVNGKMVNAMQSPGQQSTQTSTTQNDIEKLGNDTLNHPIQIVQQGNTFHSSHKLTPTQLKQIAQMLQERGQPESSERVVYRVVFPEELDLRIKNTDTLVESGRGKRGRPKKLPTPQVPVKPSMTDEETEEVKEDRKKVVARTRSGRLSRPPRHMVQHYKHLHPLDFMQPDLDDSDGGYSDYNTNSILNDKIGVEEASKELLTGLELPKRKVSTHFQCPKCTKIYLGRVRLAKHFELYPDHGSIELLPPLSSEAGAKDDVKKPPTLAVDQFKRKGKKRGPWAYVTPEEKSERRQTKLREALSVCDSDEIFKIAAKPVLNAQSLYDLMAFKSDKNVKVFLNELKALMEQVREQAGVMLSPISEKDKENNLFELRDELLCNALGLAPGIYNVNDEVFKKPDSSMDTISEQPPRKIQKISSEDGKENIEERLSRGLSESSDLSVSDFLPERKQDPNCPEVLTALTLMPRNSSPVIEPNKNVSKLLISSPQIQKQISDNPGFQKVDINGTKSPTFRKLEAVKEEFTKLPGNIDLSSCSPVFTKLDSFDEQKLENSSQTFIKLGPIQQNVIKLENSQNLDKIEDGIVNDFDNLTEGTQNFTDGFQKMISKIVPMDSDVYCDKNEKLKDTKIICKEQQSLPILQDAESMIPSSCDAGIFGNTDNLDSISHLDLDHLHLVDPSNVVDELVSERLKNIMPDNILDNNLMPNNTTNIDTELDFEALSEEFNRNTRS